MTVALALLNHGLVDHGLTDYGLAAGAGVAAGVVGYATGLASLVSYPALLALSLSPVQANMTATIALLGTAIGGTAGSRRELRGSWTMLAPLALLSLAGGVAGAVLLLTFPERSFQMVVPFLILAAALSLIAEPVVRRARAGRSTPGWWLPVGVLVVSVYGGYFGAGAGIALLAVLLVAAEWALPRSVAVKTLLLGLSNVVAAVFFAASGGVDWGLAASMGIGALLGGWLGPGVVRRVPGRVLRAVAAGGGVLLASVMLVQNVLA